MLHVVRRLRFRHIELLAIMETATTVRGAADRMQLTQPAISRMLQEIESMFEVRLFERNPRGVAPNAQGSKLIAHAIALLNELDGTRHEIEISHIQQIDFLRIGAFSGARSIARAFTQLRENRPNLRISVQEQQINLLLEALLRGELDCILGSLPPEELKQHRMDALRIDPVGEERVCVVGAPGSRWSQRRRIGWTELQDARWVLPPRDSLIRRALIQKYLDLGLPPPEPIVEVMSPLTIRSMLEFGGVELGLARSGHALEDERLGVLQSLPVQPQLRMPALAVFTRRDAKIRSSLVTDFTEALRRAIRDDM